MTTGNGGKAPNSSIMLPTIASPSIDASSTSLICVALSFSNWFDFEILLIQPLDSPRPRHYPRLP
jgi:hypothetical protein